MTEKGSLARSQSDAVVHGIKEMLLAGELGPGDRLPVESELAARLGVSRGSLREGVRALASMGVLETRQGAGTYVTSLDASILLAPIGFVVDLHSANGQQNIQQVRRVLEIEAAAYAAMSADNETVAAAREVLSRFPDAQSHYDRMDIDIEFHRIIARASGNPVLDALIEALASRTVRGRIWRAIQEVDADAKSHAEHVAILDAIEKGDSQVAGILMGAHLVGVEQFLAETQKSDLTEPDLEDIA